MEEYIPSLELVSNKIMKSVHQCIRPINIISFTGTAYVCTKCNLLISFLRGLLIDLRFLVESILIVSNDCLHSYGFVTTIVTHIRG